MNAYMKFCYSLLGRRLDDRGVGAGLAEKLYQADMDLTPGMFLAAWLIGVLLAVSMLMVGFTLLNQLLELDLQFFPAFSNPIEILLSPFFILGAILVAIVFALPFSLTSKLQNKRLAIDRELPFALSHMSIIASTGASPITIFEEIAASKHGTLSKEFEKLISMIKVGGKDVITAMTELARITPSVMLRSLLIDLTKLTHTGGNLEAYFYDRLTRVMDLKRQVQREFTQSLSLYAEMYICLILMSTLIGILFAVLGGMLMGGKIGPLSAELVFHLIVYFVVPLANALFGVMLLLAFSKRG